MHRRKLAPKDPAVGVMGGNGIAPQHLKGAVPSSLCIYGINRRLPDAQAKKAVFHPPTAIGTDLLQAMF
jgi:hypothetical protein